MGSSGSGRISDYPGSSSGGSSSDPNGGGAGGLGGNGGGASDRCANGFSTRLEDVENSLYFRKYGTLPPIGTELKVVWGKRIEAQTQGGEHVGNLPTSYNYLAACLRDGWSYVGVVQKQISQPPVSSVIVNFVATSAQ